MAHGEAIDLHLPPGGSPSQAAPIQCHLNVLCDVVRVTCLRICCRFSSVNVCAWRSDRSPIHSSHHHRSCWPHPQHCTSLPPAHAIGLCLCQAALLGATRAKVVVVMVMMVVMVKWGPNVPSVYSSGPLGLLYSERAFRLATPRGSGVLSLARGSSCPMGLLIFLVNTA